MPSAKLIYKDKKIYKDGSSPILLQFIVDRKQYTKLIISIPSKSFDKSKMKVKSSYPNYKNINLQLTKALQDAKEYITRCEIDNVKVDPKRYFTGGGKKLVDCINAVITKCEKHGQVRTAMRWKTRLYKVQNYDEKINVTDIDKEWIQGFDNYLKSIGNNPNTRATEISSIKKFSTKKFDYKLPSSESVKDKLNMEEVELLESARFEGGNIQLSLDTFLFALYNRGMRVHDVLTLKPENIVNGRLKYIMQKGRSNTRKLVDAEISEKSMAIIEKYKGQSKYVFPILKRKESNTKEFMRHLDARNSMIRKHLKKICERLEIDKKVTMHTARHSFTHIADVKGLSIRLLQQLLGHSKRETTEIYVKSLRNDEELDNSVRDLF